MCEALRRDFSGINKWNKQKLARGYQATLIPDPCIQACGTHYHHEQKGWGPKIWYLINEQIRNLGTAGYSVTFYYGDTGHALRWVNHQLKTRLDVYIIHSDVNLYWQQPTHLVKLPKACCIVFFFCMSQLFQLSVFDVPLCLN